MWGRPPAIVLLVAGILYTAGFSATRVYAVIQTWVTIHSLYPAGIPEYLLASGVFFLVTSLILAAGLWMASPKAWRMAFYYIPGYVGIGWLERGMAALHTGWPPNVPFRLLMSVLITIIAIGLLMRNSTKKFIRNENV